MKIFEIGTGYTPIPAQISAATEIVVEELTKAFQGQNLSVELIDIATNNRVENRLPLREVKVPGIFAGTDVHLGIMHKLKRVVYSIALCGELKKILKAADEKVVLHFHNQYNLFFFLKLTSPSLRKKCLIAYTNHSGIWRMDWEEIKDTISKRYFQEAECMKIADVVFVLNEETRQNVIEHLGAEEQRIIVIKNGVNTCVYHPLDPQEKELARLKWNLTGRKVILQVGSVYDNKGQLRTAEYLLPLLKKYPDLVFAYVGGIVDEEYHLKISEFAKSHNIEQQIRYLGMVSPGKSLNELYNTALATILPSLYEGFSLVSIESCAAGVPVLIDRNGPIRLGSGSISYEADTFVDTVEALLNGFFKDLGNQAREYSKLTYSWDVVAAEYAECFYRFYSTNK